MTSGSSDAASLLVRVALVEDAVVVGLCLLGCARRPVRLPG